MARVNMDNVHGEKVKNDQDNPDKIDTSLKLPPDSDTWVLPLWPHDNIPTGLPWVNRAQHTRELPAGMKGDWNIVCQRQDIDAENPSVCPACKVYNKYFSLAINMWIKDGKPRDKRNFRIKNKYDDVADIYSPRPVRLMNVINITSLFDPGDVAMKRPMKKCIFRYGKVDGCDKCHLAESCELGIRQWYIPKSIFRVGKDKKDYILDAFHLHGDLTDPSHMIPIKINRIGEKMDTRYKIDVFPSIHLALTEKMVARIDRLLPDLTTYLPSPEGDAEQLKEIYKAFFHMTDVSGSDDDDDLLTDEIRESMQGSKKKPKRSPVVQPLDEDDDSDLDAIAPGDDDDKPVLSLDGDDDDDDDLPFD